MSLDEPTVREAMARVDILSAEVSRLEGKLHQTNIRLGSASQRADILARIMEDMLGPLFLATMASWAWLYDHTEGFWGWAIFVGWIGFSLFWLYDFSKAISDVRTK